MHSVVDIVRFPKLLLRLVQRNVSLAKSGTSVVAEPNIIALVDQNERWRKFGIVCQPEHHVTHEPVHHEDSWLLNLLTKFSQLAWNAVYLLNVPVVSDNSVTLGDVACLQDKLFEVKVVAVQRERLGCKGS